MGEINWGLLNPVDTGAQVQQGFATGMALVKQVQTKNALRAYLANPDDTGAYNALAFYDPQSAATIQQQQMLRHKMDLAAQAEARTRAVGSLVAGGDNTGARKKALEGGDFELADQVQKLDDATAKKAHDNWEAAGSIALKLKGLASNEERLAYWKEARPILESEQVDAKTLDSIDPTNIGQLDAIATHAQKVTDLIAQAKPQIIALPEGGGAATFDPSTSAVHLVIAPNPGNAAAGSPVSAAPGGGTAAGKNNPGGLKDTSGKFMSFDSPAAGIAAQEGRLGRYMKSGFTTIDKIVNHYAPRQSRGGDNSEASVNNYIAHVAQRLGVNPNDTLSPALLPKLAAAMREFETGQRGPAGSPASDKVKIKADALEAIALGADPAKVKAAAAAHGVSI